MREFAMLIAQTIRQLSRICSRCALDAVGPSGCRLIRPAFGDFGSSSLGILCDSLHSPSRTVAAYSNLDRVQLPKVAGRACPLGGVTARRMSISPGSAPLSLPLRGWMESTSPLSGGGTLPCYSQDREVVFHLNLRHLLPPPRNGGFSSNCIRFFFFVKR